MTKRQKLGALVLDLVGFCIAVLDMQERRFEFLFLKRIRELNRK